MCIYDKRMGKFIRVTEKSFKIFTFQKFLPDSAQMMMSFLDFKKSGLNLEEYKEFVLNIVNWKPRKIYEFSYSIFNPNGYGNIDSNDIIT